MFERYIKYLRGPTIWGLHSTGPDDKPISCPHIGHIIRYDKSVRGQIAERMNRGQDIKQVWEVSLAYKELKSLNLTVPFTCDADSSECRALSAPGLREAYGLP